MRDIIGKKWWFFIFSALIIVPGVVSLFKFGIRPAIDFTGGTLLEVKISESKAIPQKEDLKKIADEQQLEIASLADTSDKTFLFRLKPIDKNQSKKLQDAISLKYGDVSEVRFETVGPSIGKETEQNAFKAVLIASFAIIIYVALAFRKIPKPYSSLKFGICAVIALLHDILVIIGLFSIFGQLYKVEVDSLFITALLTIMGFSVHDTIVVFDRIRENLKRMAGNSFAAIVNESIIQTMARSLSTSLTVLFTLLALLLFGGESTRWFIIALLIGVTSGTYSSVFNAAPLLVLWEEWGKKKN
jgi:preprotein translocase subunit SecF